MAPLPSEATLITAVRGFEQGGIETFPDKLQNIWGILSQTSGGFHAAEEMLVRALLKNMNGTSANAERLRRYPLTWSVLGAAFTRIPAFSLAKSLADRKFIGILQQTLKDLSRPEAGTSHADSRKRKRSGQLVFELEKQKQLPHCLQAADSVFGAIKTLLKRSDASGSQRTTNPMGAELIKSLFFSSASELMDLLVSYLTICTHALQDTPSEPYEEQVQWTSTFVSIWDLHRQGDSDALEVATHLTRLGTSLLGRLGDLSNPIDQSLRSRWSQDLGRFFTRGLILPSRAAYFNQKSLEAIQFAVEVSNLTAAVTCPILFSLVLRSPTAIGGDQTTKKDNDNWVQAVFDILEPAVREIGGDKGGAVMKSMLDAAIQHKTPLSLSSLAQVCLEYAQVGKATNWSLLLCLIQLNPDVFLIPQNGKDLLEPVLVETTTLHRQHGDFQSAVQFLVRLARGSAKTRDLAGFIKKWVEHLALPSAKPKSGLLSEPWCAEELVTAVAEVLELSVNTIQLQELLQWLDSQDDAAQVVPRLRVLEAISKGLSQPDLTDAVGTKLVDMALAGGSRLSTPLPLDGEASRWVVAERTLAWSTLDQADAVFSQAESALSKDLKGSLGDPKTFAAFKFAANAWIMQYPSGQFVAQAAQATSTLLDRLDKESAQPDASVHAETYLAWTLESAPLAFSLYVKKAGKVPPCFLSLLTSKVPATQQTLVAVGGLDGILRGYGGDAENWNLINDLIDRLTAVIEENKTGLSSSTSQSAILLLLDIPIELILRERRETLFKVLVGKSRRDKKHELPVSCWKTVLSLMVKLMGRPTFYEDMRFKDLEAIAKSIEASGEKSESGLSARQEILQLFYELSTLTFHAEQQREKSYLESAGSRLLESKFLSDLGLGKLMIMKAAISVLADSPALKHASLDLSEVSTTLAKAVVTNIKQVYTEWSKTPGDEPFQESNLLVLLANIGVADVLGPTALKGFGDLVPQLAATSRRLTDEGAKAGWDMQIFLAKHFGQLAAPSLHIQLPDAGSLQNGTSEATNPSAAGLPAVDRNSILEYLDVVSRGLDEHGRLAELQALLARTKTTSSPTGQLVGIYQLVQNVKDNRPAGDVSKDTFDLAKVHSLLCQRLVEAGSTTEFLLAAETIHLLLDERAASMTQWNIELTLSTVTTVCAALAPESVAGGSPRAYEWLTQLVAVVIKRHRKRLDGHFHLLVGTLSAVLQALVTRPYHGGASSGTVKGAGPVRDPAAFPHWEQHARRFARLLTLVCEPSAASVTSRAGPNALDSDRDRAKRYAGQYMYLVLMRYVQLQLDHVVPHAVREALAPGVYAVLDITAPPSLRVMSDAMDVSGRAVMKELYRQHQKFGKWSGI